VDSNRPRGTSPETAFIRSAERLGAALGRLPRGRRARAYLGHANAIDYLAEVVEKQVDRQKPSSGS
jgi:hypothetical protein